MPQWNSFIFFIYFFFFLVIPLTVYIQSTELYSLYPEQWIYANLCATSNYLPLAKMPRLAELLFDYL